MHDQVGNPLHSSATNRVREALPERERDGPSAWWELDVPCWEDLDHDSRDLLSVLSSALESRLSSDARTDL